MEDSLRERLLSEFEMTDAQVDKLETEGVNTPDDLALLTDADIKRITRCPLVRAKRVVQAFAPAEAVPSPENVPSDDISSAEDEIPEGTDPSKNQVSNFAESMGIDPNMFSMFMFANMTGGADMEMDISSMMPIPQIVAGYNPKIRNMPYMVMGQIQNRLDTPIVIINADGSVNAALTSEYIQGLEEGFEPTEGGVYYDTSSQPYEVIRVGVDAQSIYDADPLDSSRALAKNGMGTGRVNWSGVNLEVRQIVFYAATTTGELNSENDAHMTWLREHVSSSMSRLEFQGQCPKAMTAFNEANRTGSLPTLRVMLSRTPRKREVMPRRTRVDAPNRTGIGGGDLGEDSRF